MPDQLAVPTKDCYGMDVGVHGVPVHAYNAKDGFITVEDKKHRAALKTLGAGSRVVGFSAATAPDVRCQDCGRRQFLAFGTICTRCGGECQ